MLIFYTYANFVMILELDLVPCPLEWNQANGELTKVAKNYTAAAATIFIHTLPLTVWQNNMKM